LSNSGTSLPHTSGHKPLALASFTSEPKLGSEVPSALVRLSLAFVSVFLHVLLRQEGRGRRNTSSNIIFAFQNIFVKDSPITPLSPLAGQHLCVEVS
jgi:hypothetical protein